MWIEVPLLNLCGGLTNFGAYETLAFDKLYLSNHYYVNEEVLCNQRFQWGHTN